MRALGGEEERYPSEEEEDGEEDREPRDSRERECDAFAIGIEGVI